MGGATALALFDIDVCGSWPARGRQRWPGSNMTEKERTPMSKVDLRGKLALVTGASSGLGVDLARELAGLGCDLVLVARREERLQEVRRELEGRHAVEATVIAMDLAEEGAAQRLHDQLEDMGKTVDVLVNNAGFGLYGLSWEIPWEREQQMLRVDVMALAHMTKVFLPDMLAQDFGFILQLASYGAYVPSPTYAAYSAAKAYVLSYGEALNYELRHSRVSVTVLSPGITRTEFHQVAGQQLNLYQRLTIMDSADVARLGIQAMLGGKPSVVPGFLNLLTVWSMKLLPRRWQAALAYRSMNLP
jgi:hypothetical protein